MAQLGDVCLPKARSVIESRIQVLLANNHACLMYSKSLYQRSFDIRLESFSECVHRTVQSTLLHFCRKVHRHLLLARPSPTVARLMNRMRPSGLRTIITIYVFTFVLFCGWELIDRSIAE